MNYLQKTIWDKKLPPFSGLIVLVISLVTIFWLSRNVVLFGTKAALGNIPRNVQVSNISSSAFTVSYATDEKVFGTISYGTSNALGQVSLDDRDQQEGKPQQHRVHHITLTGLTPGTKYYFSISSDDTTFTNNNVPYEVTTIQADGTPTDHPPLAGKVTLDDDSIPTESIVYIESATSQLLSALIKVDGSYLLPLNSIRTKDLAAPEELTDKIILKMKVASSTQQSNITMFADQTDSVPLVILSKDYDFTVDTQPLASSTSASDSASISGDTKGGLPDMENKTTVSSPTIVIPEEHFEFKDPQPMFSGKAVPNAEVEIVIDEGENEIQTTVIADSNGNWEFRPNKPLRPGGHKITIGSPNSQGIMEQVSRNFIVLVDGSSFLEPSVEPTEVPTPTFTPIPTEIPTPTLELSPTIDPRTLTPTIDPNATGNNGDPNANLTTTPAPTSPDVPKVGNSLVVGGIIFSVISIIMGAILFSLL